MPNPRGLCYNLFMPARYYSPQGRVEILLSRSRVLNLIGDTARAQEGAQAALELATRTKLPESQAECLLMLADVHDQLGEMQAMRQEALAAMDLYRRLGDRYGEGQATGMLGIAVSSLEGPLAARPHYEQALVIARTLDDRRYLHACLLEMGWILIRTKEYDRAVRHLEEGLEMARSEEDSSQEAFGTSCLGEIALHQGRPEEALAYHQQALAIREQIGDKWFQGITWSWLSADWEALGDLPMARKARERALAINRAIGIRSGIAHDLDLLAGLCEGQGELDRALALCREALDFCRRYEEKRRLPFLLCRLGSVHIARGEWEAAGAAAREALAGDPPLPVKALATLTLARLALVRSDRLLAFGLLKEAGEAAADSSDPAHRFNVQAFWAEFHLDFRDAVSARKPLEAMHGLLSGQRGKDAGPRLEVLAACLLACEGDVGEAEMVFANALSPLQEMGLRWEEARSGLRFGKALGGEKGRSYLQTARALFSEIGAAGWAALCDQALKS